MSEKEPPACHVCKDKTGPFKMCTFINTDKTSNTMRLCKDCEELCFEVYYPKENPDLFKE